MCPTYLQRAKSPLGMCFDYGRMRCTTYTPARARACPIDTQANIMHCGRTILSGILSSHAIYLGCPRSDALFPTSARDYIIRSPPSPPELLILKKRTFPFDHPRQPIDTIVRSAVKTSRSKVTNCGTPYIAELIIIISI